MENADTLMYNRKKHYGGILCCFEKILSPAVLIANIAPGLKKRLLSAGRKVFVPIQIIAENSNMIPSVESHPARNLLIFSNSTKETFPCNIKSPPPQEAG